MLNTLTSSLRNAFRRTRQVKIEAALIDGQLTNIHLCSAVLPNRFAHQYFDKRLRTFKKLDVCISVNEITTRSTKEYPRSISLTDIVKICTKRSHRLNIKGLDATLIITPDPWTLIGSKGDQAMIGCITQSPEACPASTHVFVITATTQASANAASFHAHPVATWDNDMRTHELFMRALRPRRTYIMGADCMDGYYHPDTTCRLIDLANLASTTGSQTTILGFSFNQQPAPTIGGLGGICHWTFLRTAAFRCESQSTVGLLFRVQVSE